MKKILLLLFTILALVACKTVELSVVSNHNAIDTIYLSKYIKENIYKRDSIYIKEKGDSIIVDRWHTEIVDNSRIDTIFISHSDTTYVDKLLTVKEQYVPKWIWILLIITCSITAAVLVKIGIKIYTTIQTGGTSGLLKKLF